MHKEISLSHKGSMKEGKKAPSMEWRDERSAWYRVGAPMVGNKKPQTLGN